MNTLSRLDAYVASFIVPFSSSTSPQLKSHLGPDTAGEPTPGPSRLSTLPPTPRKNRRRRRPKPTVSTVKLPPPTTPLLLRIVLGLWSILLSFWTSLVVETRAERVKRRKRGLTIVRELVGEAGSEGEGEGEGEGEAEGSASEVEAGIASADDWTDPVTRAPVDEKLEQPGDDGFMGGTVAGDGEKGDKFTFRLRSAEKKEYSLALPETPPPGPKTFIQQPTPPSILSNPIKPSPVPRKASNRLLPNPIATAVLDPTVPAVPASKTFSTAIAPVPPPRQHTTPFHLRKTLILDLDETLIHSTSRPISYAASAGGGLLGLSLGGLLGGKAKRREGHTVEVVLNGRSTTYHVYKRPHVDYFLKKVS